MISLRQLTDRFPDDNGSLTRFESGSLFIRKKNAINKQSPLQSVLCTNSQMCLFTLVKSYVLFYFFHCFYLYLTLKNSDSFLVLTKEQVQN